VRNFLRRQFDTAYPDRRPLWLRYAVALFCIAAALLLTMLMQQVGTITPLLFYFPAIIISTIYGGLGPGLVSIVLAALVVEIWVLPPAGAVPPFGWQYMETIIFLIVAVTLVLLIYALQRARSRLYAEREDLRTALAAVAASEERFRIAQELSLDAFTILEAVRDENSAIVDFRWQYVNPRAAEILKGERSQFEGHRLLDVLPGYKSSSELFVRYVQIVETGRPHDIEIAYDADNIHGWFRNMAVKLGDGVAVSFYDITERKHTERQLSYQAFLLENVSDAVFAFDQDLRIAMWNRGAEALYGWKAEEAIGRPASEVVRTAATVAEAKARVFEVEVGAKHQFEALHRNRAGDLLYIDSTAAPIRGEDGSTIGYVVVNRDMTARKRYEQELEDLNASLEHRVRKRTAELERSNLELDQFAYVASHDLKAPLRAIALLAEWITEDAAPLLPAASLAHLAKLNGRVRRLDKLLSDLLDYSRAGHISSDPEQVDTRQLVQTIVELLNPPLGFTVVAGDSLPILYTERVPLETVLRNLIQNAIKHHDHPARGSAWITAAEVLTENSTGHASEHGPKRPARGPVVEFAIADDGPGIAPEYHERMFKLFHTLRPRDQVEGSGMGLSVVKKTVESRGGAVRLVSQKGAGAIFYFTWPS
jgi:PAS domain S-box-containing protein